MAKSTKGAKRIKVAVALWVLRTREEVIEGVKLLGDAQRELVRAETEVDDAIGGVAAHHAPLTESSKKRITELQPGIQTWCEAHRNELTGNGKVKLADLTTDEAQWRNRPPSVSTHGMDNVIGLLRRLGFERFIRVKEKINKDTILSEKDAVKNTPGTVIESDIEDSSMTLLEQNVWQKQHISYLKQSFFSYSGISAVGPCMPETEENQAMMFECIQCERDITVLCFHNAIVVMSGKYHAPAVYITLVCPYRSQHFSADMPVMEFLRPDGEDSQ